MLRILKYESIFRRYMTKVCSNSLNISKESNKFLCNFGNFRIDKRKFKLFQSEYNAVIATLSRSFGVSEREILRHVDSALLTSKSSSDSNEKANDKSSKPTKGDSVKTSQSPQQQKSSPPPSSSSPGNGNNNNNNGKNDNEEKLMSVLTKAVLWMITVYLFITFISLLFPNKANPETGTRYVSWNEFAHHMLSAGEVKELIIRPDMEMVTIILHDGAIVKGRKVDSTIYHMAVADASKFEQKLREEEKRLGISEGVSVSYDRHSDITGRLLVLFLLFAVFMSLMTRFRGMKSPINMDTFTQMGRAKFTLVDPFEGGKGVLFKDVAGLQEAKQEVMEFVDYLKNPEKYQKLGAKVPKGALLLGPPGCGKTLLAKAVATEARVPFLSMNGSEFIEMIGGLGAARVRDLFKEARKRAPCIIYIDEIDAIGRQRSGVGNINQTSSGESEQTLNQLLVEMDGMSSKEGVLMLASTNRADILDRALLRPGRFDRHILIDLPTLFERKEIFEKHLSSISLEKGPTIYSDRLARLTPGFSGADIANVCNEAALHAARSMQKSVVDKDLEYAVERLVGGTEKRSHALTHAERRIIAYHESGHALVGWLLPNSDILLKVTIVPRTSLALGFAQYTPSEQKLFTKEELFGKMCMALGGRAAESLMFNKITTGAQDDLQKVTKIAYAQIKKFGMSETLGPVYIPDENETDTLIQLDKPFSKATESIIDREALRLISDAYTNAENILKENKEKLIKLAEALLQRETLTYDQVVDLIGPPAQESKRRKVEPVDFEDSLRNLSATTGQVHDSQ